MTDELAVVPTAAALYPDDPTAMVREATAQADTLAQVIESRNLYATISGRRHILAEGWTLLGAMVGVSAVTEWTRPIVTEDGHGWEARVYCVHTATDRLVGAAESMCLRSENRWRTADEYALRSMAETRARSKALRGCLGFIVDLAGFAATPEDEMPGHMERDPVAPELAERIAEDYAVLSKLAEADHPAAQTVKDALYAEVGDRWRQTPADMDSAIGGRVAAVLDGHGELIDAAANDLEQQEGATDASASG